MAVELGVSHESAHNFLHNQLGFRKVSAARWVSRQFTDAHNGSQRTISLRHLERFENEGEDLLERIITGDEKWVYNFEPVNKR